MKKIVILLMVFAVFACKNKASVNNSSEKSVEKEVLFSGTYKGVLPCASCSGIETILKINTDKTYVFEQKYLEQEEGSYEKTNGEFNISQNGTVITLANEAKFQFKIQNNSLLMLSSKGEQIKGELSESYKLKKVN